jgi:hypothetical protein
MPYSPSVIFCTSCKKHKPIGEFYDKKETCKSCCRESSLIFYHTVGKKRNKDQRVPSYWGNRLVA